MRGEKGNTDLTTINLGDKLEVRAGKLLLLEETDDFRINSETALVAPLSSHFALKLAYLIKFNNAPPSPELVKTDRTLTAGLQLSW